MLVLRRTRPRRVTRGSQAILTKRGSALHSCRSLGLLFAARRATMVRNLKMRKRRPFLPTRSCRKMTGPGDSRRMRSATTASSGSRSRERDGGHDDVEQALPGARDCVTRAALEPQYGHLLPAQALQKRIDAAHGLRHHLEGKVVLDEAPGGGCGVLRVFGGEGEHDLVGGAAQLLSERPAQSDPAPWTTGTASRR